MSGLADDRGGQKCRANAWPERDRVETIDVRQVGTLPLPTFSGPRSSMRGTRRYVISSGRQRNVFTGGSPPSVQVGNLAK